MESNTCMPHKGYSSLELIAVGNNPGIRGSQENLAAKACTFGCGVTYRIIICSGKSQKNVVTNSAASIRRVLLHRWLHRCIPPTAFMSLPVAYATAFCSSASPIPSSIPSCAGAT